MSDNHQHRFTVLAGGLSHERDVSLVSGARLLYALRSEGYDVDVRDADSTLLDGLKRDQVDAVYSALHGGIGEDGAVQTALEIYDIPFVGSPSSSCRISYDKAAAREVVRGAGLDVPQYISLPVAAFRELGARHLMESIVERLGLPLVVKPSRGGSVLGCNGVESSADLSKALIESFAFGDTALVEEFIDGLDVSVSVIELGGVAEALPPISLTYDKKDQFDFGARYTAERISLEAPAQLPMSILTILKDQALGSHRALSLRDLSRTDFIVSANRIVHLETAVSPGLTENSLFPIALTAEGRTLGGTIGHMLEAAASQALSQTRDGSE